MSDEIKIFEPVPMREAGKDEFWLQDQIRADPSCRGLGELGQIRKERMQSSGGRLDLLLESPGDHSRYAVEVMLDETDGAYIVRTIEYWHRKRRRHPTKQHYRCVEPLKNRRQSPDGIAPWNAC